MALTAFGSLIADARNQMPAHSWFVKGNADTNWYALEVDPATGALPVTSIGGAPGVVDFGASATAQRVAALVGNATGAANFNYGAAGAQTLRTAAQVGNSTGAADFNFGAAGAQTLRTAAQVGNPTGGADFGAGAIGAQTLRSAAILANAAGVVDYNFGAAGAQTVRTAAQIGNATGAALFGAGTTTAQVLRVVLPTDQTSIPVTQSGTWTPTFSALDFGASAAALRTAAQVGNATGAADFNFGAVGAQTLRSAAQIGNATGAALFGAGTTTAQVLRVVLPTDQTSIPVTQSGTWTPTFSALDFGASANGLRVASLVGNATGVADFNYGTIGAQSLRAAAQIGNATGAADFNSGAAGAQTLRSVLATRHEAAATPVSVRLTSDGTSFSRSMSLKYRNDYTGTSVTTAAYTQVVASSAAAINRLWIDDSSGQIMILATGAASSEVDLLYIPRGGFAGPIEVNIAAGTRISLKALSATASTGDIVINGTN